jgi:predicted exporter
MALKSRLALAISILFALALGLYVHREIRLSSGLSDLLVESTGRELAAISARLIESRPSRTMVLSVSAENLDVAIEGTRRWSAVLASHPEVENVRTGPDPALFEAVHALYFPRRLAFASSEPEEELPERISDEGLHRAAVRLRQTLGGPRGPLVKDLAGADPLLLFLDHVERLRLQLAGRVSVESGHFVTDDRDAALLFLTTRHSALDAEHQGPLEEFLLATFDEVRSGMGEPLTLKRAGIHRFAVTSERQARGDMERISMLSAGAVALLFVMAFGSLRLLVLAMIPPAAGILAASALGLAWTGRIQIITIVFGSTLIGVCIDYPIHYFNHHRRMPRGTDPWESLSHVRGAIGLGAVTSAVGFCGLAASGVPGIREMGVFAVTGVLAALAATCWTLPALLPMEIRGGWLLNQAARSRLRLRGPHLHPRTLLAVGFVFAASGIARVEWQDDVFALDLPSRQDWIAEDQLVSASVSRMDVGRFVAVVAGEMETALKRNDVVYARLESARKRGYLDGFLSLHPLLASARLQQRNVALLERSLDAGRLREIYESEGFQPAALEPFVRALEEPVPPLRYEDLMMSPLAAAVDPFVMDLGDGVAILTFLRDPSDGSWLETAFADMEGTSYFDQRRVLAGLYREYRRQASVLMGVGLIGVLLLLYVRYRDAGRAIAVATPALLAGACTLGLLGWLGIPVNLLHLLGLLLVLSIGVDYTVFVAAAEGDRTALESARSSILLAAASTGIAFGLLCLSEHPILYSLGMAAGVGVPLSLLFTFLTRAAWVGRDGAAE